MSAGSWDDVTPTLVRISAHLERLPLRCRALALAALVGKGERYRERAGARRCDTLPASGFENQVPLLTAAASFSPNSRSSSALMSLTARKARPAWVQRQMLKPCTCSIVGGCSGPESRAVAGA